MTDRTCEACKFAHVLWRKGDSYTTDNHRPPYESISRERSWTAVECRRYAPRGPVACANGPDGADYSAFPSVGEADWCAEWADKNPKYLPGDTQ